MNYKQIPHEWCTDSAGMVQVSKRRGKHFSKWAPAWIPSAYNLHSKKTFLLSHGLTFYLDGGHLN